MTLKPHRPWRMLAPLASVLALFGLWSGYWFLAQAAAKSYATSYREKLAGKGLKLTCEDESWGGYPFRFEFSCSKPVVQLVGNRSARSTALLILAQAYNPMHIIALVDGPTSVSGVFTEPVDLTHDRAIASLVFGGEELPRISAEVTNLSAVNRLSAKDVQIHIRPAKNGGADIAITFEAGEIASPSKPSLDIDSGQALARLKPNREVDIQSANLQSGTLRLSAAGTVSLDQQHRLAGAVAVETNDVNKLMTAIDPHLHLSDRERAAIQTLLGLLGTNSKANIIAQNGELFVGPIKAGELKPLY